jgi:hypothetical protein
MSMVTPCLQWIQVQLFPESWAGGTGQCSVYHSLMSMGTTCGAIMVAVASSATIS